MRRPSRTTAGSAAAPVAGSSPGTAGSSAVRRRRSRLLAAVAALGLAAVVAVPHVLPAVADDLDDRRAAAEARARAAAGAKEEAEAALEGLEGDLAAAAAALVAVQNQVPAAQQRLTDAQVALDTAQREQTAIAGRLADAEAQETSLGATIAEGDARVTELRAAIGELARQAYRTGTTSSSLDVVLGAESVEDFAQRYGLASTALRTQSQVLEQLSTAQAAARSSQARLVAVRERITELKADADAKVVEADRARAEAQEAKEALDALLAEQQARAAALEVQKGDLERQLQALDAQRASLEQELSAIIAEQRARDTTVRVPSGRVSGAVFGNPTSIDPIYVTSEYGMRLHPTLGYVRLHAGIDLRTYCGTPIYAGREGTVLWARLRSGFGNQVMVDHGYVDGNSLMTSYNHMTRFVVAGGQHVDRGQLLGYSGNTGTSAACHLHFEVYVNGATVNPRPLLGL
ncbi:peptidoglycan DD-metalloendopeptidase family protein [Cellulomonas marina]|uniref:Murein DD-endopeptidase MepM and murein hydrolase activator NlpD, contain LysM domain n=1 Tax=Cellulomonas marina TaxID=988821 RepID=A0A1I0V2W4_9CELL|nr:peptidoglycan DD-metalloendopeptidase family protein [Cellulomonas marina]GIG28276.1 metalloendopeptidase [Cellulomonas marina]SFA70377.1 Murein DD-endopeptidase MepM and murein hydrolase activator NlpD, contain LysM domain [Cellulomonas marina]